MAADLRLNDQDLREALPNGARERIVRTNVVPTKSLSREGGGHWDRLLVVVLLCAFGAEKKLC
jgi:hypothetical protein